MAFTPARTRRTFNSTKSSSKSGSSIPKSSTGKTSSGADYSVVEGNPIATETNRQKAEGLISTASGTKLNASKVGVSGGAPTQEKSLLPVSTSDVALADLTKKLQDFRDTLAGMEQQKQNVAQQEQLAKQEEANRKQLEADQKLQQDKLSIERQNADTKAAALQGVSSGSIEDMATKAVQAGLVGSTMDYRKAVQNGTSAEIDAKLSRAPEIQTESDYSTQDYRSDITSLDRISDRMYDRFISQTNQIKNGTFPLSASENAILSETRKSFERTKQEQATANAAYVDAVKQSGIRRGGEYTDKQYAGEIQAAVSDGIQKIADIDSKAALTLAELQKGFDEENYKIINDQYTAFNNLMKTKTEAISALHQSAMEHEKFVYQKAKDQRDFVAQQEQREIDNERQATQLADNLLTSASNRATDALQREKLIAEITAAKNESLSGVPLLPKNVQTTVDKISNQWDNEPIVKNYNTAILAKDFIDSLPDDTVNPSDDQALIYAFAKIMDPDSVVREGEYATVQKYAQSWAKSFGKGVTQAVAGTGFLSEEARKNIKDTINTRVSSMEQQYDNVYNEYGRRIENVGAPVGTGVKYITDYKKAFTNANKTTDDYLDESLGELENSASSGDQVIEEFLQGLNLTY